MERSSGECSAGVISLFYQQYSASDFSTRCQPNIFSSLINNGTKKPRIAGPISLLNKDISPAYLPGWGTGHQDSIDENRARSSGADPGVDAAYAEDNFDNPARRPSAGNFAAAHAITCAS
jgi:hypothetical protein